MSIFAKLLKIKCFTIRNFTKIAKIQISQYNILEKNRKDKKKMTNEFNVYKIMLVGLGPHAKESI